MSENVSGPPRSGGSHIPGNGGHESSASLEGGGVSLPEDRVSAFIDLGTNSVRLLVVRIEPGGNITTITQQKETVRLGEGEFVGKRLQPAAMERTLQVCRRFADLLRSHGATDIVSVATSATREAVNRDEFVARLRAETGLDVRVISGREEARLIYMGMAHSLHLDGRTALFVDIGGGSTEIMVGGRDGYRFLDSLALGAIRLTTTLAGSVDTDRPVSKEDYKLIRRKVRYTASHTLQQVASQSFEPAFGSSGTITTLAAVAARTAESPPEADGVLSYEELKRVAALVCGLDIDERRRLPGLSPERADIIIAGAAILHTIMKSLHLSEIRAVSDIGVREGLLYDHLSRLGYSELRELSVRARSVLQLGRSCRFDEPHALAVAAFALQLFDSAREAGLHEFAGAERELLEYAALLHDIGTFLSYSNHHTHTFYLIRNADMLGFDDRELAVIAASALFHRKGLPSARVQAFAALDADDRARVRTLSLLLRLAETLDRTHAGMIGGVRLRLPDKKRVVLEIKAAGDIQLELWGIEKGRRNIEKALRRRLEIEVVGAAPADREGAEEEGRR